MKKDYALEKFLEDISVNHEFEFYYLKKMYLLSISEYGFIFTDINEQNYYIYNT